ncbi:MAG: hypothetical protein GWN18_03535, partial [Thermoplasmata archaeon]|nr:hypothetical protein [Thermoplasmata archaeon]NIS11086.1 hypothetical protein [Thermoplasmata archaeon]NIS19030.1 hypothetical protein [Thermoplasmata archaeon]NIT76084.1 hypothetical protein [Thermoplasmata archaeon]NIU48181.1 hypothetical protein [Thermoplasmata archaeon]
YHRRMEAPITDETVELEEFIPEEAEERMEEALQPPSLLVRIFRRKGGAEEEATEVEPVTGE